MFLRYVGPQSGMGTIFNEVSILNSFLPHDVDPNAPKQHLGFDERQFDESLRGIARLRGEREIPFIQLRPLIGLRGEETVEIEDGLRIESMGDDEVIEAAAWGVLPTDMNQYREIRSKRGTTLALKRRYTVPRVILHAFPGDAGGGEHFFERDSEVPHMLSILAKGRVDLGPTFLYCAAGWPYSIHSIMQPKAFSDYRDDSRDMSLPRGVEREAQRTWTALQGSAGFYKIASRRFYQGHLREFVEDRLIDDAICGEALLTAESRKNKSPRFRLNAAYYLGGNDRPERLRIFGLFSNAYKIRSGIVHGSGPEPSHLQIGGNAVELYEFEEAFEAELRRILRKMADTGDSAAPMQWNRIVIGHQP